MPRVFDGIAGTLSGVFGDTVTIYPGGGPGKEVRGIFRIRPVDIETGYGADPAAHATEMAEMRLHQADMTGFAVGDRLDAPDGETYRARPWQPNGSPASDAMVTIPLELDGG